MKTVTRVAAFVLFSVGFASTLPAMAADKVLTTKTGMTVYIFDKDAPGTSNCNGSCATAWPPISTDSMAPSRDIGTITRADGTKQAAYKNQPIYLYAADSKPGDKTGDGVNGTWHIVQPGQSAKASKASKAPAPSSSSGSDY